MSTSNFSSSQQSTTTSNSFFDRKKTLAILATALLLSLAVNVVLVLRNSDNLLQNTSATCPGVCCDQATYHTISEGSLDSMLCNYRNMDWWKTSPVFSNDNSFSYSLWKQRTSTLSNGSMYDGNYDARYMDISRESLENYLCRLRKLGENKTEYIRFYYIRYGDNCYNPNFAQKHSLAMMPVDKNLNEMPNTSFFDPSLASKSLIVTSQIANHNEICPPEPPRGCSPRLTKLDITPATYR